MESSLQPARLCSKCEVVKFDDSQGYEVLSTSGEQHLDFDTNSDDREREFTLDFQIDDTFPDLPTLSESANNGCDFCSFLKKILQSSEIRCRFSATILDLEGQILPITIRLYYRWGPWLARHSKGLDSLVVSLYVDANEFRTLDGSRDLEVEINLMVDTDLGDGYSTGNDPCAKWLRILPLPIPNHLDPTKVEWMDSHLHDCFEGGHSEKCTSRVSNEPALPTRLIDVTTATPRLIDSSQIQEIGIKTPGGHPRYAALSYCWGSATDVALQLKTEIALESQRRAGISTSTLSKTLEDAVSLVRALSIPYLWVDALCIVQDDISDWQRESSRMGEIYANAYVTICSLSASCLSRFLEPDILPVVIPFRSSVNTDIVGSYALRYEIVGTMAKEIRVLPDVHNSRWLQRGLTHQELIMSGRLLLFGPSSAHFVCPSITVSEGEQLQSKSWTFLLRELPTDLDELYNQWTESVVKDHSGRLFSKRSDVLPALAGLAKHFAEAINDEFIAGLWKGDLLRGLMWKYCLSPGPEAHSFSDLLSMLSSQDLYVSPSWSWVGRRTIDFDLYESDGIRLSDIKRECDAVASVVVQGLNPFGRVRSGSLRIGSKTYDLKPPIQLSDPENYYPRRYRIRISDSAIAFCAFDWAVRPGLIIKENLKVVALLSINRTEATGNGLNEWQEISRSYGGDGGRTLYGLIVHKANREDCFFRVGTFVAEAEKGAGMKMFDGWRMETIDII